jgi:hypothetical protein
MRYFWLCSTCSRSLTIQASGIGRVRIAPKYTSPYDDHDRPSAEEWVPTDPEERSPMQDVKSKLDALMKELEFLDHGGYRIAMGWRPPLVFEDSPICPKPQYAVCPDARCVLLDLVPEGQRDQIVPCRHIPLNKMGETLDTLYNTATMEEIENTLRAWLQKEITDIKQRSEVHENEAA